MKFECVYYYYSKNIKIFIGEFTTIISEKEREINHRDRNKLCLLFFVFYYEKKNSENNKQNETEKL